MCRLSAVNLEGRSSFCSLLFETIPLSGPFFSVPDLLPNSFIKLDITGLVGKGGNEGRASFSFSQFLSLSIGRAGGSGGGPDGFSELVIFFILDIFDFEP